MGKAAGLVDMILFFPGSWTSKEVVQTMLKARADQELKAIDGATPLWVAAQNRQVDVMRCLIEARADVDPGKLDGPAAMLLAAVSSVVNEARNEAA